MNFVLFAISSPLHYFNALFLTSPPRIQPRAKVRKTTENSNRIKYTYTHNSYSKSNEVFYENFFLLPENIFPCMLLPLFFSIPFLHFFPPLSFFF